jgi:riboflavin biosynthesis pyrimidine reductase
MRRALLLSAFALLTACEQRVSRYDSSLRDDIAGVWVYPREQTGITTILVTDGVTWKSYGYAENSISTREDAKWLVRGDLEKAVQQLKRESGKGLLVGGVKLPLALAELGLIDEYEFVVQPRLAGHGPTLFAGLSRHVT